MELPSVQSAVLNIDIPNFSDPNRYDNGYEEIIYPPFREIDYDTFYRYFGIKICPNGDRNENEGYVSTFIFVHCWSSTGTLKFSITVTVSLVDTNGNLRYPQTFAREEMLELMDKDDMIYCFGLDRYMSRDTVLKSDALMPDGTIRIRYEIIYVATYSDLREHGLESLGMQQIQFFPEHIPTFSVPLSRKNNKGTEYNCLKLSSALRRALCRKSPVFNAMLNCPMTENTTGELLIPDLPELPYELDPPDNTSPLFDSDYTFFTIFNLIYYINNDTLNHVRSANEILGLYFMADMYEISDLKEDCRKKLKYTLDFSIAQRVLRMAQRRGDNILKEIAIKYIAAYIEDKNMLKMWKSLIEDPELVSLLKDTFAQKIGLDTELTYCETIEQFEVSDVEDNKSKFDFYQ